MATDSPVSADDYDRPPVVRWLEVMLLIVFFLMLWLPMGQQGFLTEHWMKVGAYLAPIVLLFSFAGRTKSDGPWFRDVRLLAALLLTAYLIHQVEEHWIDLMGRIYPLHEILNSLLRDRIGESAYGAMTPKTLFLINTSLVWLPGLLAILTAPRHVFPTLAMAGIVLINGVAHLGQSLFGLSYNPGLLTAVVLFVPLGVTCYIVMLRRPDIRPKHIVASIVWGVGAHGLLIIGLMASAVYEWVPVGVYYLALIGWSILPSLVFRETNISQYHQTNSVR